jgi:prolyl oligopeptidase
MCTTPAFARAGAPTRTVRRMMSAAAVVLLSGTLACVGHATSSGAAPQREPMPIRYPETRKADVVDVYHGVEIADPYRWLEDAASEETRAWIEAQNQLTHGVLEAIESRGAIRDRLRHLWNFERYGRPFKEGGRYFFHHNTGLQNHAVLYVADGLDAEPRVLLDPNAMSEDGSVAVAATSVSPDGRWLAYAISSGGSDWRTWRVRDVETGEDLDDIVEWSKFSGASWLPDGSGFYYSAYDPPETEEALTGANYHQKLYFHRLGTAQAEDRLVYERPDEKRWGFSGSVTDDGRWLVIHVWRGTEPKNAIFYRDLTRPDAEVVELLSDFDSSYRFVGNEGSVFYFRTDLDAPLGRVVAIDVTDPARERWREIIAESEDTLQGVSHVGGRLVAEYLQDAHAAVRIHGMDGTLEREVALPGLGSASGFGGRKDDPETFYGFTGFTHPWTVYRLDVATGESRVWREPSVDFDPDAFVTRQTFYESPDGTRVPMFITHRRDVVLDGTNPTYLYGYGGFRVSLTPWFSVSHLVWLEMGGVLAIPNLRGGGEYGDAWHRAGIREKRQNVFDDFIAAAEWLVDEGYTRPDRLVIGGRSNGGLLVGAVMTQRPELFAVALPGVGVLDMLRYHQFTIGWAWASDYGTSDDPEMFEALRAYSPLHNLAPGTRYPATFVTTADHDDRVVPAHSFKFAAALQAAQGGDAPVLIRIQTRAGHGAFTPTEVTIEEIADQWAFVAHVLGLEAPLAEPVGPRAAGATP